MKAKLQIFKYFDYLQILIFSFREWYLNGDYLVLLVSVILILPLSLLKNLGKQWSTIKIKILWGNRLIQCLSLEVLCELTTVSKLVSWA